jgi:hypothetical protein
MDKELNDIKDIFVELVDIGLKVSPSYTPNNNLDMEEPFWDLTKVKEISVDIRPYVTLQSEDTFKYEVISEYVIMFIDYINTVWEDIEVIYDFEYILNWNGRELIQDGYTKEEAPDDDTDIVNINIKVKNKKIKKEGFFKRFIKKFESFE